MISIYFRYKSLYLVKYISTLPDSELKRLKETKHTKAKIVPLNLPTKRLVNGMTERDEENKMLHDSAANNSALALTIDAVDQRELKIRLKVSHIFEFITMIILAKSSKS